MLLIQEYDLEISHVAGTRNHSANTLSRNPAGLTQDQIEAMTQPREILVSTINLGVDPLIRRDIQCLAMLQEQEQKLWEIRKKVRKKDPIVVGRFIIHEEILYSTSNPGPPLRKTCLPEALASKLIMYVHGHAGSDKCIRLINNVFHVKNVGQRTRKMLSRCEKRQKVQHPNWRYEVESRPHLPNRVEELVSVDFYGPVPQGRGGVRYLFVCLDVFSKYIKLYPLKSAMARASLKRLMEDYITVMKPETIVSDNGTQYTSKTWVQGLKDADIAV
jgi:hypothetical protein